MIARLKEQAGIHSEVVGNVLDAVADAIQVDEDMQIYTSGATNIFKYPELPISRAPRRLSVHLRKTAAYRAGNTDPFAGGQYRNSGLYRK